MPRVRNTSARSIPLPGVTAFLAAAVSIVAAETKKNMLQKLLLRLAELSIVLILIAAILFAWRQERAERSHLQSQLSAANQALAAASASQQSRDTQLATTLAAIAAQKKASATLTPDQLLAAIATQAHLPTPLTLQTPASAATPGEPGTSTNFATSPAANPAGNQPARTLAAISEQAAAQANPPLARGSRPQSKSLSENVSNSLPSNSPVPSSSNPPPSSSAELPNAPTAQIPAADLGPLYNYLLDCQACQSKLAAAQSDLADEKTKTAALTQSRNAALKAAKGGTLLQRTTRALKWFAIGAAAGAIAAKSVR